MFAVHLGRQGVFLFEEATQFSHVEIDKPKVIVGPCVGGDDFEVLGRNQTLGDLSEIGSALTLTASYLAGGAEDPLSCDRIAAPVRGGRGSTRFADLPVWVGERLAWTGGAGLARHNRVLSSLQRFAE